MPKIVDHDARRREIIEATMRVIRRIGVEATTIREIAREAGYSSGVLAHYFENKDEILVMTHRAAFKQVRERIQDRVDSTISVDALRIALYEALPLDQQRILEAHIDVSFWAQAILNPSLQAARTQSYLNTHAGWAQRIGEMRAAGLVRCRESDEDLADEIVMIIDALSAEALLHPAHVTAEKQKRIVENFLARIQRPS